MLSRIIMDRINNHKGSSQDKIANSIQQCTDFRQLRDTLDFLFRYGIIEVDRKKVGHLYLNSLKDSPEEEE